MGVNYQKQAPNIYKFLLEMATLADPDLETVNVRVPFEKKDEIALNTYNGGLFFTNYEHPNVSLTCYFYPNNREPGIIRWRVELDRGSDILGTPLNPCLSFRSYNMTIEEVEKQMSPILWRLKRRYQTEVKNRNKERETNLADEIEKLRKQINNLIQEKQELGESK